MIYNFSLVSDRIKKLVKTNSTYLYYTQPNEPSL